MLRGCLQQLIIMRLGDHGSSNNEGEVDGTHNEDGQVKIRGIDEKHEKVVENVFGCLAQFERLNRLYFDLICHYVLHPSMFLLPPYKYIAYFF